jgi:CheY-like chemotaxis protein
MATVLIIDDNEDISSLLKDYLVARGYFVHIASEGTAGVEMARKFHPDVITMDFNMPGANGVEVYKELRQFPDTSIIPVIFLSSVLSGLIRRMVSVSPLVRFFKKPCELADLEKMISELAALPKQAPPPPLPDSIFKQSSADDDTR